MKVTNYTQADALQVLRKARETADLLIKDLEARPVETVGETVTDLLAHAEARLHRIVDAGLLDLQRGAEITGSFADFDRLAAHYKERRRPR